MADLSTIITSAAVATVITGGVAYLSSSRQRSHETEMQKLADARTLRDRKIERTWWETRAHFRQSPFFGFTGARIQSS